MWANQGGLAAVLASELTVSGTVVVSGLAGAVAGGTAVWSLRALAAGSDRLQSDLLRPFAAVAAVIAVGAVGLPVAARQLRAGVLSVVPLVTFLLVFVPWNVFAFRYAGRGSLLTRRRVLAVGSLVTVLLVLYVSVAAGVFQPSQESYSSVLLGASTLLLALVALTFVSSGLVLTESYRHGNIPLASGVAAVFPVAVLVIGIQVVSLSDVLTRELLAGLHLLAAAVALPVAIVRYDVLATRPGATTLGERTVIQDLDEPVLVSDWDGRVILSNRRAERLFGADLDGRELEDIVGTDVATLRELSTLECWTEVGYKRFDPRVSSVTGSHDRRVGQTVTLIDVTDRAMLRQRVQVLNRIFRHNIRNDLDVIRSHAEFALERETGNGDGTEADESIERILDVTDDIVELSAEAREIERLTRNSSTDQSVVNLPQLVDAVVETVARDRSDVSVAVDVPAVELSVNRELLRFALRNLVDNAVEHNDSPSPRVEVRGTERTSGVWITVVDNGPGIPDAEWQVIEAGREEVHDHLTSLGLWGTKWAVQQMGGELSRRDSESGAAVVIDLPTKSSTANDSTGGQKR
jgi:signal transduction histidine kinase